MEYLNKAGLGVSGGQLVAQRVVAVYSGLASDVRDIATRFGIDDIDASTLIFVTLQEAIDASLTGRGDHIKIMPGHAETVATAAAITTTGKAGLIITGYGSGDNRPVFTFSAVAATFALVADDCHVSGIVGLASADVLTNPFIVTGDGNTLDIEWQDGSATLEALTAVRLDTADNTVVKIRYRGFIAGNACTAVVTIDDCDGVRIDVDAYGISSVAIVNMVDTASTDVIVNGYMYNSGTTDGSKNVIDTITGSLWFASFHDGAAGARFSGGSASALASDDISAVKVDTAAILVDTGTTIPATLAIAVTPIGSTFWTVSSVQSDAIPNNTQTGGAITGASSGGDLVLEEMIIQADGTGWAAPTKIEFSTDNVKGLTGAAAPILLDVIAEFGANLTWATKDAETSAVPFVLESGKKLFIHGDDAAGTGTGVCLVYCKWSRLANGATVAKADLS